MTQKLRNARSKTRRNARRKAKKLSEAQAAEIAGKIGSDKVMPCKDPQPGCVVNEKVDVAYINVGQPMNDCSSCINGSDCPTTGTPCPDISKE